MSCVTTHVSLFSFRAVDAFGRSPSGTAGATTEAAPTPGEVAARAALAEQEALVAKYEAEMEALRAQVADAQTAVEAQGALLCFPCILWCSGEVWWDWFCVPCPLPFFKRERSPGLVADSNHPLPPPPPLQLRVHH